MTPKQEKRIAEDYSRMYVALRRIAAFMSPEQLQKRGEKQFGLPYPEVLEAAYDNMQGEAKIALRRLVKPAQLTAKEQPCE